MINYERINLDENVPIKLLNLNINVEEAQDIEKHWHRSIEILAPIKGTLSIWIEGRVRTIKPGEIYIINTEEIHSILANKMESYKGYALQISYEYLKECYSEIDSIYFKQVKEPVVLKKMITYIKKISNDYKIKNTHYSLKVGSTLLMMVYTLLTEQKARRNDAKIIVSDKYRERIIEVVNYIGDNYKEDITGEFLANYFNLSYGHLSRLFKKHLKITIKEYLTIVRLNKCKCELINSDYSIIQIALENGFPNIQSFYKAFKKEFKVTPVEYRRNIKK